MVFLKQSTCCAVTPDTHQWFKGNANEITDNHYIALYNDLTVHLVPLPSADSPEVNAVNTIKRLLHSHTSVNHTNSNCPQPSYKNSTLSNNSTKFALKQYFSPTWPVHHPLATIQFNNARIKNNHRQSIWWHHQFMQACKTVQENTAKLIENTISQALTKPQDIIPPNPNLYSRNSWTSNSSYEPNWTSSWPTNNYNMSQQSNNYMHNLQRPHKSHTSSHVYVNQQSPNQTSFDFNQSVVELF